MGKINFDIFLHFNTAPLFFAFSFWIPKFSLALLPPSLCVSSPPTWAVLHLWPGLSTMKLQHSKEHCATFGLISSYPRGFFPHVSQIIHCSPEEHHLLLLLRKKKKNSACLLVELILSKTHLSHQLRGSGFSHNLHLFFQDFFLNLHGPTFSLDISAEIVLGFSKMREPFFV